VSANQVLSKRTSELPSTVPELSAWDKRKSSNAVLTNTCPSSFISQADRSKSNDSQTNNDPQLNCDISSTQAVPVNTSPKNWYSIAGISVRFLDPALSGRVFGKQKDKGFFVNENEKPYLNIKKAFDAIQQRKLRDQTLNSQGYAFDTEDRQQLKREIAMQEEELLWKMKMNFKHIDGMIEARKKGPLLSEMERYNTQKVEKLV